MITIKQLIEIMKFQLTNFNDENVKIDENTIHKDVLSEDDGFSHVNSVNIYKDVIQFTLIKQGHAGKKWPNNWLDLSVSELATKLLS